MWTVFRMRVPSTALFKSQRSLAKFKYSVAAFSLVSFLIGGSLIANDQSAASLDGVSVDSSIDPFPLQIAAPENDKNRSSATYKLVASGIRLVTFLGFKVYGVGLYIPETSEKTVTSLMRAFLEQNKHMLPEAILNDKSKSQEFVAQLSENVPYAMKVVPVRNTDYGHLRDGLTKSILANPMAKSMRDEIADGVEQLREVFAGFRGSVPKNDTLWVVSDTKHTSITYENQKKEQKRLGVVAQPAIAKVLMVLYLSNAKPLSEPLRKSFVAYVAGQFQ